MKKLFGIPGITLGSVVLSGCNYSDKDSNDDILELTCTRGSLSTNSEREIKATYYSSDDEGNVESGYYILVNGEHDDLDEGDIEDIESGASISGYDNHRDYLIATGNMSGNLTCE